MIWFLIWGIGPGGRVRVIVNRVYRASIIRVGVRFSISIIMS